MPKPLNLQELERVSGESPLGPLPPGFTAGFTFESNCHDGSPTWTTFHPPSGSLIITCATCHKVLVAIAVSTADRDTMVDIEPGYMTAWPCSDRTVHEVS